MGGAGRLKLNLSAQRIQCWRRVCHRGNYPPVDGQCVSRCDFACLLPQGYRWTCCLAGCFHLQVDSEFSETYASCILLMPLDYPLFQSGSPFMWLGRAMCFSCREVFNTLFGRLLDVQYGCVVHCQK